MPFKNGILNQLFGDKNFSDIDKRIDNLIDNLPPSSYNSNASPETNASDLISDLVTDEDSSSKESLSGGGDELSSLFQNISIPRERQARYNLYDEIIKSVPLISRIVKVYASNVIQKNPTTGESLVFEKQKNLGTDESQKGEEAQEFIEQFFKSFDVSRKLRNTIIPKQLKYGDCYVEIVSVNEEKMNLPSDSSILNEAKNLDSDLDAISQSSNSLSSFDSCVSRFADLITDVRIVEDEGEDNSSTEASDHSTGNDNSEDTKETKGKKRETHDFNDVVFKIHSPHNIITLQTKHGTCLGYLEVMQETETTGFGFSQSLSGIVGKVNQLSNRQGQSDEKLTDRLVHHTLKKVIKKAKNGKTSSKIKNQDTEELLKTLDDSVYNIVKRMFIEQGFNNKKKYSSGFTPMRTRFIPTSRMVAFNNPNVSDYDPYSQSIIEDLILPGKLYMLNTLSNSVMKLSRSSLIRKWTLDIGPQRMASQNIQKLKREIHNSRITLDDLNSFKSIPKIMSDYKDMFVLSQQGQTPVDVDIQSHGDPNVKTEDLEDARKEIIALSGVPAPYLGLHDVVELREQLVHSNISFANEVINIQENIVESLNQISDIVARIKGLKYRPSSYAKVGLIPPVVLILQVIESTLSSVGNIAGVFSNLNINYDPFYLLQQYVPHIDWDDFREKAQQYNSESKTKQDLGGGEEEQGGGGGFGF